MLIAVIEMYVIFFFFKQKTAYEMRISDWSSDVCSSDLDVEAEGVEAALVRPDDRAVDAHRRLIIDRAEVEHDILAAPVGGDGEAAAIPDSVVGGDPARDARELDRKSTRLNSSH